MRSTPRIVSIGKRCMDYGYEFHWGAYARPWMVCPSGKRVDLDVINNVPYLPACTHHFCAPSADACPVVLGAPAPSVVRDDPEGAEPAISRPPGLELALSPDRGKCLKLYRTSGSMTRLTGRLFAVMSDPGWQCSIRRALNVQRRSTIYTILE